MCGARLVGGTSVNHRGSARVKRLAFSHLALVAALAAATPLVASAKVILVISPHPDDETLMAAGRVRRSLASGVRHEDG